MSIAGCFFDTASQMERRSPRLESTEHHSSDGATLCPISVVRKKKKKKLEKFAIVVQPQMIKTTSLFCFCCKIWTVWSCDLQGSDYNGVTPSTLKVKWNILRSLQHVTQVSRGQRRSGLQQSAAAVLFTPHWPHWINMVAVWGRGFTLEFLLNCFIWFRNAVMAISTQPSIINWTYLESNLIL